MNEPTNIERVVMGRVHRISWLRLIVSGAVFALGVAALALWGIGREVWVAKVFENGPQDPVGHFLYLMYAFEHTRFVVQILVVTTLAALIYFSRELVRAFADKYGGHPRPV